MNSWRTVGPVVVVALLLAAGLLFLTPARSKLPGTTHRATYTNPVLRWDFADPHVIKASDGYYYAYSTENLTYERLAYIQVARSRDMVSWELLSDALPEKPEWARTTRDFWAPGVIEADRRFYMYFSGIPDEGEGMCLGVAKSESPAGPFAPEDEPLRCGDDFTNIDPMPFDDPKTGKRLLYWGSDSSPIMVQELAPDRTDFARGSKPKELIYPSGLQQYESLIEGAFVVYREPYYYLFYSGRQLLRPARKLRGDGRPLAQRHRALRETGRGDGRVRRQRHPADERALERDRAQRRRQRRSGTGLDPLPRLRPGRPL